MTPLGLPPEALDQLMPMHMLVSETGHIRRVGPTMAKLRPDMALVGARLLEVFELRRPRNITSVSELRASDGAAMSLRFRDAPQTPLKGLAVALPGQGGLLINFSFGIAAVDAVGLYALNGADFPHTDLTVEMLYLVEAKTAVLNEFRRLNHRLEGAKVAAEVQAFTDTLTGLKNRRAMDHILDRYTETGDSFALMQMDLDYFKQVNDTLGHAAGDLVLEQVARILTEETREQDTIVRAGGDEFVLIFHRLTDSGDLASIADRILERLEEPILYGDKPCKISASIGVAISSEYQHPDVDTMLMHADQATYASKNGGRGQYTFVAALEELPLEQRAN